MVNQLLSLKARNKSHLFTSHPNEEKSVMESPLCWSAMVGSPYILVISIVFRVFLHMSIPIRI